MELQSKLDAYRTKKNREEKLNNLKTTLKSFVHWQKDENIKESEQEELLEDICDDEDTPAVPQKVSETSIPPEVPEQAAPENKLKREFYVAVFVIWTIMYYIFIRMQFGIIFLIVSALFGMYFNTRTGPKNANEASAYSVFNRNCESIDGTLTAEQFEREIRFGPQSVR